ncbi:HET-domain-containing protein [Annulohypoxylon maeteangense]|uniref:HET-domain-containing protein n=1 Tax=Annulohypoxylon maeteangense TaxID=1927788 RepID=UPI002008AA91|nr:HET-domain-containing protein [Annulohypoxylon maeteangense]KAI0883780.1 HET-domain-containing protein [Annulohypoxylon maeteangense]
MYLLNAKTKKLRFFHEDEREPYAILSHTWGPDEITFQELPVIVACGEGIASHPSTSKAGYRKIKGCCEQARRSGIEWVWVDTCCIDKSSSAELSEAINSMYRWYKEAQVCFVYLEDVSHDNTDLSAVDSPFRKSRWFTRGWTLQELIAPDTVWFFSNSWSFLGARSDIENLLAEITGISFGLLSEYGIHYFSTAQRMCWAAKRKTSRREDLAYCLLGIFDVNMPLIYGEGDKAFRRLQEEIIRQSTDETIFAWGFESSYAFSRINEENETVSFLAKSPSEFIGCSSVVPSESQITDGFEITQKGIHIKLEMSEDYYIIFNCRSTEDDRGNIAIKVRCYDVCGESVHLDRGSSTPALIASRLLGHTPGPRPYYSKTPTKVSTFYLHIATIPSTISLHEKYYRLSTAIETGGIVYEVLHVDEHLKVIRDQQRLTIISTKPPKLDIYSVFFSCKADDTPYIYIKLVLRPEERDGGRYRFEYLLAESAVPLVSPTKGRLEHLDWKSFLTINRLRITFTRIRRGVTALDGRETGGLIGWVKEFYPSPPKYLYDSTDGITTLQS